MAIEVTVRHRRVPGAIQSYAWGKADGLIEAFPQVEHVHVIIDRQKRLEVAEVVVQAKLHLRVEARESGESLRTALDGAMVKVERQLQRALEKVKDRHRHPGPRGRSSRRAAGSGGEIEEGLL